MLQILDNLVSFNTLIWLFLVVFILHDFEEIIWVESWFKKNYNDIIDRVPKFAKNQVEELSQTTTAQFAMAVATEFIIFIPFTFMASEFNKYTVFVIFNIIMFVHVFPHIGMSIYFRRLTPGVVTSILIVLPYTLYLFYRLIYQEYIAFSFIVMCIPIAILVFIPAVKLLHIIGKKISLLLDV